MRRRPPPELGVGADVREPHRVGVLQHEPEQPVLARYRPDRAPLLVADPVGEELREPAVLVRYPQRRVAGVHQPAGRREDGLQHLVDGQVGGDREHGRAHRAQFLPITVSHKVHASRATAAKGQPRT